MNGAKQQQEYIASVASRIVQGSRIWSICVVLTFREVMRSNMWNLVAFTSTL